MAWDFIQITDSLEKVVIFGASLAAIWGVVWASLKWIFNPLITWFTTIFVEDRKKLDYIHSQLSKNSGSSLLDRVLGIEVSVNKMEKRQQMRNNLSNDPEFECDKEGSLVFVNRACTRLYGVTERELLHFEWIKWIYSEDVGRVLETVDRTIKQGSDFKSRHRIVSSEGETKTVLVEALALRDKEDKVMGYVGTMVEQN